MATGDYAKRANDNFEPMKMSRVLLDTYIKQEVAHYLQASGIKLEGRDRRKQMRFLGVPSLSAMVEHAVKPSQK